uniref:Uncharacterized protein n=1 Tax=Rhizophora mucronata TaxID=61149 RepID=A0A2P2QDC9_RHIMU
MNHYRQSNSFIIKFCRFLKWLVRSLPHRIFIIAVSQTLFFDCA